MTIAKAMQKISRGILADDPEKRELSCQDVKNVQDRLSRDVGMLVDDRDIKVYFSAFASAYWKTHAKKPSRRKDFSFVHVS